MVEKSRFNPASAVVSKDGKRILPLPAQVMWMNSIRPGWRVTSDGLNVVEMHDALEDGTKIVRYMGVGHVSVIDEEGRRVLSVPASAEANCPDWAQMIFEKGTILALNMLGYSVRNISESQWNEFYNRLPETPPAVTRTSHAPGLFEMSEKNSGKTPSAKMPDEDKDEESYPLSELKSPESDVLKDEEDFASNNSDINFNEAFNAFRRSGLAERASKEGKGKTQEENLEYAFEKYCFSIVGVPWSVANGEEKKQVMKSLNERIGGK